MRELLTEFCLTVPIGRRALHNTILALLENLTNISPTFLISCIRQQWEHLGELDQRIDNVTRTNLMYARQSDVTRRLQTIPGIGPITASALEAYVGNAV
ncbi:MAG: hypothetical protein NMNS01_22590 [Nitrosomonas sp.]|nr:MAG: hypothetical protein NMNS01_22590 [Nitrosomonas sp.]